MGASKREYWQIQCPLCSAITYYRVVNQVEPCFDGWRKWPILRCRCGHHFTKRESELAVHTCCEPIPSPTPLQKRQSVAVELEVVPGIFCKREGG